MKHLLTIDRQIILLLSGEIGSGKSTLSKLLQERFVCEVCKTNHALKLKASRERKGTLDRGFLQSFGEKLDKTTAGKWVRDHFVDLFASEFSKKNFYIVDSIRISKQIEHFREAYGYSVVHIHFKASPQTLADRFFKREKEKGTYGNDAEIRKRYKEYKTNETEKNVSTLERIADLVLDTDKCSNDDVYTRVLSFLKLLPPTHNQLVDVVVGAQFGSEGKGQIVGHLATEYDCIMRVGGPNAGHTVYNSTSIDGKDVFHLIPSGARRNRKTKLILGAGTIINKEKLLQEISTFDLDDAERLIIDENAVIISEEDITVEEGNQISSTKQGVGGATANNILARLKEHNSHKAKNCADLKKYIGSATEELEELYRCNKRILLEGTQGTGLSLHHGIYPYVTSRDTTVSGCISEAGISPMRVRKIIMVTRTYPIRVGGPSGPFLSNDIKWEAIAKRSGIKLEELTNTEITTTTKRERRVAEFSWFLFRKACELNSPTDIALTFADYFSKNNKKAMRYEQLTDETKLFIDEIERCSGVRVSIIGTGFNHRSIIDRRNW